MALFVLGDPHLALGCDKPMDIFEGWQGYVPKLEANWRRLVGPDDTVVLAGDISWAMKLENCYDDFAFLQSLPGKKLLLKGNHDYWWGTMAKMVQYISEHGFDSLSFLHNNCYVVDGMAVCGTRSWLFDEGQPEDARVMNREAGRLRASLEAARQTAPALERVVFLHYPPAYSGQVAQEMLDAMNDYGVRRCYYGHLHAASIRRALQGPVQGIACKLISADALDFTPYRVVPKAVGMGGPL